MNSLIEYLKKVKDFRHLKGQRHPLWLILLIVILGLMAGHLRYRDLEAFAISQQHLWTKYFSISGGGVPSYSTIRRVMIGVDVDSLIEVFNQWASDLTATQDDSEWLAIDGKSLKSTLQHYSSHQQDFISIISLFCQKNGLVLHLNKMQNKKRSEIGIVQDIARDSGLTNKVLTGDALHCQKKTVQLITEGNNDYLIAVKKNQLTLYNYLEHQATTTIPSSQKITEDTSHGRKITRTVSVFPVVEPVSKEWANSQNFIRVQRSGHRGGKSYHQTAYYLSSRHESAEVFGEKIRGHWRIENQLHWVKDVIFQEDNSPLHQFGAATNFSILSTIAMNLFRLLGFLSITEGRRWLSTRFWLLPILLE